MRDIWITSDTHFFHENIIRYCARPFVDAQEMNEILLEKWNSVVKPGDIVYHLGDVFMGGAQDKFGAFWARFNGKKRLVVGNHDNVKFLSSGGFFQKVMMWREFKDHGLLLSHVPIHKNHIRGGYDNTINVHGHIHTDTVVDDKGNPDPRYKCVCVEQTNYTPVHIEELRA